jgi:ABC-2 type transport system permease protein
MWAIVIKEFRQLRRDKRTVALMVVAPLLLLVVFGFAARFERAQQPDPARRRGRQSQAGQPFDLTGTDVAHATKQNATKQKGAPSLRFRRSGAQRW